MNPGFVIATTQVFRFGPGHRDRPMKIMGKGRDPAAAWQMIADERDTPERIIEFFPCIRPSVFASSAREIWSLHLPQSFVIPWVRLSRALQQVRNRASPPVYATRPTIPTVPACISTQSDLQKRHRL